MAEASEFPKLENLWVEADSDTLFCCSCLSKIGSAALIRTFRLHRLRRGNELLRHTKIISTPFDEDIVISDWHLQCLLQSGIRYSAISHVWDRDISDTQCSGRQKPQPLHVRRLAVQLPLFIYRGLLKSGEISELDEIWHDYISVPQWSDDIKDRILLAIPDIYRSAHVTIIHFEDLRKDSVRLLYEGQTSDERLRAITDICNLKWFTRVWTAMEYARSSQVIAMDEDADVCSKREDPLLLNRMHHVWFDEVPKYQSVHDLEARAGIGKKLVPWSLGPLREIGKGKPSVFGRAFALLSKRRRRSEHDFLHALLGLVEPTSDRPLEHDFDREYARIARLCLAAGDYSPLLLTPRLQGYNKRWDIIEGFNDLGIWPLGAGRQLSDFHHDFSFENGDLENGDPVLKLQRLGVVSQIHERLGADVMAEFAHDASIVLKATGPDLDSFIDTLGWRLYDEKVDFIKQKLAAGSQSNKLAAILQERHDKGPEDSWPIEGPDGARWVAEAMTLSLTGPGGSAGEPFSRMAWVNSHGGTIHVGYAGGQCLLSVSCTACHRTFVFRAGLFESPSNVRGAIAYRIPGLEYQFSHRNGIGIVMKDGRVVGRMAWATPACKCLEFGKVKIKMPALPDPRPRPYSFDFIEYTY